MPRFGDIVTKKKNMHVNCIHRVISSIVIYLIMVKFIGRKQLFIVFFFGEHNIRNYHMVEAAL